MNFIAPSTHQPPDWRDNVGYSKSVTQKLREISRAFGFTIAPSVLEDHEMLARLRWQLDRRLGKLNPLSTRALTKLYFEYLRLGVPFLSSSARTSEFIGRAVKEFGRHQLDVEFEARAANGEFIAPVAEELANKAMAKYHFLGYGRGNSLHLGMFCLGSDTPTAVATLSPWDIDHANPAIAAIGAQASEVLVLSRLLSMPVNPRVTLSHFIARVISWVREERCEVKAVVTYCNPNAGHYGTVYRGANFLPLCHEEHAFIPFEGEDYLSPRQAWRLHNLGELNPPLANLRLSAIRPMPLLLYWYPIRRAGLTIAHTAISVQCPYPPDLRRAADARVVRA